MEIVKRNLDDIGNIKEMREKNGLTQVDVALHCGVSLQAYYRWEAGITKSISEERFQKLKDILSSGKRNAAIEKQNV